jgi:hypothetical protein
MIQRYLSDAHEQLVLQRVAWQDGGCQRCLQPLADAHIIHARPVKRQADAVPTAQLIAAGHGMASHHRRQHIIIASQEHSITDDRSA